jgi:ATP-dependent exoDNAse (exonuclease V) alpha subunit
MTQEEALEVLKLGYNVYLTGPAGSGKTFLLNKFIKYLKDHGRGVGVTASTGIAATHIGGITIHSWSGLGIKDNLSKEDIKKILKRRYLRKRFEKTRTLVIDEISMLNNFQFDSLNEICRNFKNNPRPFGGMQIVCSGDFFQLPPIAREAETGFVTESKIWKNMDMKICYLEGQYRQEKEENLYLLLNNIRSNKIEEAKKLLTGIVYKKSEEPVRLHTHNIDVDVINNLELSKIKEPAFAYNMQFKGNERIIDVLRTGCLAPERLVLKRGAKVMFVKNNFEEGYVNGTLGKVADFNSRNMPIIKTFSGRLIEPQAMSWTIEEEETGSLKAEIRQIPLRLAWAITIHKSQGMNLDAAEINLSRCFVEGMGYVALSRLRSLDGLNLLGINEMAFRVNEKVLKLDKKLRKMSKALAKELKSL